MHADPTPVDVVMLMLRHRFATSSAAPAPVEAAVATDVLDDDVVLADFQADAVARLRSIMQRRGGAMLADSVGLGKTHVAATLVRQRIASGSAVLVTGPAALAAHWRKHLRRVDGWRWVSHTSMSRRGAPALDGGAGRALVVVDEAHAFRNPASRRYRALALACINADVLFLTATPVNNSLRDFLHLLRVFARDDAFADIGVPSLPGAVELAEAGNSGALRRVATDVMVRRTRELLRTYHHSAFQRASRAHGSASIRFPDREPVRWVHYDLDSCYGGITMQLSLALTSLRFTAHHAGGAAPAELLRLGLLKRLESSVPAFTASLQTHKRILREFVAAADDGYLLDVRTARRFMPDVDGSVQLPMREVALQRWPAGLSHAATVHAARSDLDIIDGLLTSLSAAPRDDPKVGALHHLVMDELAAETVLVFTEFRHTALALWSALRHAGGIALVTGSGARLGAAPASPAAVLRRFTTPRAVPAHQRVRVLIATDVLAEGLNLQVARVVVGFDVPWNPVRLAQRIGRVDRLGSSHASVLPVVFAPDAGVETLLRLMRRVRRKLRHIRVVGGDTPWQTATTAADTDVAEALRLEYARHAAGPAPPTDHYGRSAGPAMAAVLWHEPSRGCLACVADNAACWLVLCREDVRRPEVDSTHAENVALAVIRGLLPTASLPAGEDARHWRHNASRRTLAAVRRVQRAATRIDVTASRAAPTGRAAALVHRWIRERGDACTAADWRAADEVLCWLGAPGSAAREIVVADLIRGTAPATAVARLRAACAASPPDVSAAAPAALTSTGRGHLRIIAVLELVPAAAHSRPVDLSSSFVYLGRLTDNPA